MWSKVRELASLELMCSVSVDEGIAWDCIATKTRQRGVLLPNSIGPLDFASLTPTNMSNAMANIVLYREDLWVHLGGYFGLFDDELLYLWLADRISYSTGCQLEADI